MRILCVGPYWRGSNAGGLFRAFSRKGCIIEVLDEFYYISLRSKSKLTKAAERVIRKRQADEFNQAIQSHISIFKPDILFIYKGAFVYPESVLFAKSVRCITALFYPDVSMTAHGGYIPNTIPIYDIIFTTKTFGIKDMSEQFGVQNSFFIPHGFDPDIHKIVKIARREHDMFDCDVSFIGTYSPKKEQSLSFLKTHFPELTLKIWGDQWQRATNSELFSCIQYQPVLGDFYAIAIQCSLINLGILSEKVIGATSGDLITSRTFHIPACGGFMLHEKNAESALYFKEGEEAAFYVDNHDLVEKVKYYLENETERLAIKERGHLRVLREHSLDQRAQLILDHLYGIN